MTGWLRVRKKPVVVHARRVDERTAVETREGTVVAEPGDYLMCGGDGELYPCDRVIFERTYSIVEDVEEPPDHMDVDALRGYPA